MIEDTISKLYNSYENQTIQTTPIKNSFPANQNLDLNLINLYPNSNKLEFFCQNKIRAATEGDSSIKALETIKKKYTQSQYDFPV